MIELNIRDAIYVAGFIITAVTAVWKLGGVLNKINTTLALLEKRLEEISPKLSDHESRIREIEKALWAAKHHE
jgi:hypothetical protein